MGKGLKGFRKIFVFTLKQHTRTKGYKAAVVIGVLLCLLLPALIMTAMEVFGGEDGKAVNFPDINEVHVVDNSSTAQVDMSFLNALGHEGFNDIVYVGWGRDLDGALKEAQGTEDALVLVIDEGEAGYALSVLLPENTVLTTDDARSFEGFMQENFAYVLMEKSGLDHESLSALLMPVEVETVANDVANDADITELSDEERAAEDMKSVLSFVLPYGLMMVMYFLVLFYGQGVATSVIMEKNSKLMDNFLISVKPGAMVTGKTLAIALAGAIQFLSWAAAAICGFALGNLIVTTINPATDMMLIQLFRGLGSLSGLFSVPGIIVALMILLAGFLLYCSLSAIGGSLAGKPEDLSSTNVLFTLILVVSFFAALYSGFGETSAILTWIPFTAILITPGQVMLGEVSVATGLGVLALVLVVSYLIMLLAGRLYRIMALHKGNPPSLSKVTGMLKNK